MEYGHVFPGYRRKRCPGMCELPDSGFGDGRREKITVVLENRVEAPTWCLDGLGPARFWATVQLDPGIFSSVSLENRSDRYQVIVEEGSHRFSGLHGDFTSYVDAAKPRG